MKLDHIAIWVSDLEKVKNYYMAFFDATPNDLYVNSATGFRSYFLSFGAGSSRIEIMHRADIPESVNETVEKQHQGYIHLALDAGTPQKVDDMAQKLRKEGYEILRGPRITGDGYYEFETLDPENNRIEVICNMNNSIVDNGCK